MQEQHQDDLLKSPEAAAVAILPVGEIIDRSTIYGEIRDRVHSQDDSFFFF